MPKCSYCPREGKWILNITFYQDTKEKPRYGITIDAEGFFCDNHKQVLTMKDLVGPVTRQEADVVFQLRGWGKIKWEDTLLDWRPVAVLETTSINGMGKL